MERDLFTIRTVCLDLSTLTGELDASGQHELLEDDGALGTDNYMIVAGDIP